ncbi:hypothetical protein, partial [Salmonella enterica]|uniref:hypothetical protein n=1 Tax=Salmonella enterica TaxID=28901 RepID=UPI0020CE0CE9
SVVSKRARIAPSSSATDLAGIFSSCNVFWTWISVCSLAATPRWLAAIHADPMKLGLDLRGGVHFLMEVDIDTALGKLQEQN